MQLIIIAVALAVLSNPYTCFGYVGCTLSSDPSSLTTDCQNIQPPNVTIPNVGVEQTSVFGEKFKRITLPTGLTDGLVTQMSPIYSKIPAWNADGTRLMLQANNGYFHLFNGVSYEYIERLDGSVNMSYSGTDPEPRWSKTDPNIFYYVYGMQFRSYNISTHTSTTIHTFTDAECGDTGLVMIHNGDEGNSDDSDRYWTWYVQVGEPTYAQKRVIVYDRQTDAVVATAGYGSNGLCGSIACPTSANWVGMSHSGNHVVINWNLDATDGVLTDRGKGSEVFNRSLVYQNTSSEKNWHCDLAQLDDGTDVFVGNAQMTGVNAYTAIRAVSLNDGTIKKSCMLPVSRYTHNSARANSAGLKGWVLYSTYDQTGSQGGILTDGGVFALENFAVNMNTCEVARIAHTQSNWSSENYASEPHASVNFDFTKIVWGSNWRDQSGSVQAYVADVSILSSGSTCYNSVQDGDETGVDCGGVCPSCSTPTILIPTPFRLSTGEPVGIQQ